MIKRPAEVLAVDAGRITVRSGPISDCARCARGEGCGGGMVARMLGDRHQEFELALDGAPSPAVGARVQLGLADDALLRLTAVVYLPPLAALVSALVLARLLVPASEAAALLAVPVGLGLGLLLGRGLARRADADGRLRPVLLGPCEDAEA